MGTFQKLQPALVAVVAILFIPGLPPYDELEFIDMAPIKPLQGAMDPKDYGLDKLERALEGRVFGPESTEASPTEPGVFYTGLLDGDIVKITNNGTQLTSLGIRLSKDCPSSSFDLYDPHRCGMPIGLRFRKDGRHLIVVDSYLGIFEIDIQTGKLQNLVPPNEYVDGLYNRIYNSVALSEETGKIYYTVSSTNYYFHEGAAEVYATPSGRLMVYDPKTKKSTVLGEKIHFPKGILLSSTEDYVVVSEPPQNRLRKYWLKGLKAGVWEVLANGFPGMPDNLNRSPDGNILFPLVAVQMPDAFDPLDFIYRRPWIRKIVLRVIHMIQLPLDFLAAKLNLSIAKFLSYYILNFDSGTYLFPAYSIVIEMDWNGKILKSWHARSLQKGSTFFSSANIINGHMYLGSPTNGFIGRLKMN